MPEKTPAKFELQTPVNAQVEKRLASHKKNIRTYESGVQKSGAQLFGYSYLVGREILQAKEALSHGELEKWLGREFPEIPRSRLTRYQSFASALEAKLVETKTAKGVLILPTVGNMAGAKKSFSKAEQAEILKAVPEVMDGKGMMEFMRDCKLLKEPERQKHHPRGPVDPRVAAEEERLLADEQGRDLAGMMTTIAMGTILEEMPEARLAELEGARIDLGHRIAEVRENRKKKPVGSGRRTSVRSVSSVAPSTLNSQPS